MSRYSRSTKVYEAVLADGTLVNIALDISMAKQESMRISCTRISK